MHDILFIRVYSTNKQSKFLTFLGSYIDYHVKEDETIKGYNKHKLYLGHINGSKYIITYIN